MCLNDYKKLEIQHEYSTFVTMREVNSLDYDEDWEYCMKILNCVPNINIDGAQKELKEMMCYDEETDCLMGGDWTYEMLDSILLKYIREAGGDLYINNDDYTLYLNYAE